MSSKTPRRDLQEWWSFDSVPNVGSWWKFCRCCHSTDSNSRSIRNLYLLQDSRKRHGWINIIKKREKNKILINKKISINEFKKTYEHTLTIESKLYGQFKTWSNQTNKGDQRILNRISICYYLVLIQWIVFFVHKTLKHFKVHTWAVRSTA